ncbi:MAG: GNAT family N-acetyltransferase [Ignavibacteriaceae bacterium]|nr:GNAT family N-acetyltransferase [Ignavibacteriaceae bacterium]
MENEESGKIVIRNAVEKDIPLILNFIKELAEYEKLSHHVKVTEELLKESLFGQRRFVEVLIAEYDDEPAGQALFFHNFSSFVGRPGIYLEDLYVRPHLRKNGIGKALLQSLVNLAKERNCGRVEWAVLDWNKPSINFYKSIGASPLNEWIIFRLTEDKF